MEQSQKVKDRDKAQLIWAIMKFIKEHSKVVKGKVLVLVNFKVELSIRVNGEMTNHMD
jgi:hypothetical protein